MANRSPTTPCPGRRATSPSHGGAHSPCMAKDVPMQPVESGARRQKRRSPEMSSSPALGSGPAAGALPRRCGTARTIKAALPAAASASSANRARQSATRSSISAGAVAVTAPSAPNMMSTPLASERRSRGNQSVTAFSPAISAAAEPMPISARPSANSARLCASANSPAPPAASGSRTACTRRGP